MVTLSEDTASAAAKLANVETQVGIWAKEYDQLNQGRYAYPDKLKIAKTKYEDGKSGAYERELRKEIKRKSTALSRIKKYMAKNTITSI